MLSAINNMNINLDLISRTIRISHNKSLRLRQRTHSRGINITLKGKRRTLRQLTLIRNTLASYLISILTTEHRNIRTLRSVII